MSEENVFPPFVKVDFGESGGRMEWQTFADIQAWLTELQGSWSWLPNGWTPNNNAWNIVVGGLTAPLQQFQQAETY